MRSIFHLAYAAATSLLSYPVGYTQFDIWRFCGNGKFVPLLGGVGPRDRPPVPLEPEPAAPPLPDVPPPPVEPPVPVAVPPVPVT